MTFDAVRNKAVFPNVYQCVASRGGRNAKANSSAGRTNVAPCGRGRGTGERDCGASRSYEIDAEERKGCDG